MTSTLHDLAINDTPASGDISRSGRLETHLVRFPPPVRAHLITSNAQDFRAIRASLAFKLICW